MEAPLILLIWWIFWFIVFLRSAKIEKSLLMYAVTFLISGFLPFLFLLYVLRKALERLKDT